MRSALAAKQIWVAVILLFEELWTHSLVGSTRTRAASLERMQTGSIISSSIARSSIRNKYLVVDISKNEQEVEESSWSDTRG